MPVRYAHLTSGLRGCYADSNGGPVRFATRRQLRALVEGEAASFRDAGYAGASRRAVSAFVQAYWTRISAANPGYLDTVMPLRPEGCDSYSWGVFLSPCSRADYLAAVDD